VSTNASAARACSPVVEGVGVGEAVGLVGLDAVVDVPADVGLRAGPERRWRVDDDVSATEGEEEDCALEEAILAVAKVDVPFCTTLQATAEKARKSDVMKQIKGRDESLHVIPERKGFTS
jgi:hypothetical protein